MGDRNPPLKTDEQYPLLKIDGGGDKNHVAPAQSAITPTEWVVTCKKAIRCTRWPGKVPCLPHFLVTRDTYRKFRQSDLKVLRPVYSYAN